MSRSIEDRGEEPLIRPVVEPFQRFIHTESAAGILAGLVIGKPVGVTLASWLAVRSGVATLPDDVSWCHIIGTGFLAGIGFTMSLFIEGLAFWENAARRSCQGGHPGGVGNGWIHRVGISETRSSDPSQREFPVCQNGVTCAPEDPASRSADLCLAGGDRRHGAAGRMGRASVIFGAVYLVVGFEKWIRQTVRSARRGDHRLGKDL